MQQALQQAVLTSVAASVLEAELVAIFIRAKGVFDMARGKKTPPELIYAIMSAWAVTRNAEEVARTLGMPQTTVKDVIASHRDEPEFIKLMERQKETFSKNAERLINKAVRRLERLLDDEESVIPANQLSTVIGTLYDKKALADGNATENVSVEVKLPPGADEYAG